MYFKDKNVLVAAIDHGFCTCKTPHVVFENGIQESGVVPAFTEKTMRYKVGEGRLPMKNVKTEDEDYFLLTLAGIAYGMDYYGLRYADVVVAAGLPFARFGAEKQDFTEMMGKMQENIEKQQVAVRQISDMDVPEVVGLEMLEGKIQLTKLTKEIVDTFVEERLEVRWKFS